MSDDSMQALRAYLDAIRAAPISDAVKLGRLLADAWDDFEGSDAESMAADKLARGIEVVLWQPPKLTFVIERHGGTVLGSTRADRQGWEIDLVNKTAVSTRVGHRQLLSMAPRLDVQSIADDVAAAIQSGRQDRRLKWFPDGSVRVLVGQVIATDSGYKATVAGRRRRFWRALDERLPRWTRDQRGAYRATES
jgi:hypothetical protein